MIHEFARLTIIIHNHSPISIFLLQPWGTEVSMMVGEPGVEVVEVVEGSTQPGVGWWGGEDDLSDESGSNKSAGRVP